MQQADQLAQGLFLGQAYTKVGLVQGLELLHFIGRGGGQVHKCSGRIKDLFALWVGGLDVWFPFGMLEIVPPTRTTQT